MRSVGQREGLGFEHGCGSSILERVVRECLTEKVICEQRAEGVKERALEESCRLRKQQGQGRKSGPGPRVARRPGARRAARGAGDLRPQRAREGFRQEGNCPRKLRAF